jgi:hypothetical protein
MEGVEVLFDKDFVVYECSHHCEFHDKTVKQYSGS